MNIQLDVKQVYSQIIDKLKENNLDHITDKELEKHFEFFPSDFRYDLEVKLDKKGYLKRSNNTPKILVEFKREWDNRGLKDLLEKGQFTFKPSNEKLLDAIVNSPIAFSDGRLVCIDSNTKDIDGNEEEYHGTINNSNASNSYRVKRAKEQKEVLDKK